MSYLLTHMFICLLVAFILGLFLGWLLCKICGSCKCKSCCSKSKADTDVSVPAAAANVAPVEAASEAIDLNTAVDLDVAEYCVETLEGVGPQTGDLFRGYGVASVGDYLRKLHTPESRVKAADALNIKVDPVHDWASMSDLLRVQGINHQYAELTYVSGVKTVTELGQSSAADLVARMEAANNAGKQLIAPSVPNVSEVEGWVSRARSMKAVVTV